MKKSEMEKIIPGRWDRGFYQYQSEFEEKALKVLRSGRYILGEEVTGFENEFAEFIGTKYCVGVGNGLDALRIAFHILGIGDGDEVIVQGNTFIASVMGITMNGARPVFVEPDECYGLDPKEIEKRITPRTKAVLAVHLYGQPCEMEEIADLCKRHHLYLVEDCAQSHGATLNGKMTGTIGDIACFSFYPGKNLGAFGDGGAIVTDNEELYQAARIFRNYGSEKRYHNQVVGVNSRLDEIQAGLLRVRLSHLTELNEERAEICERYLKEIQNDKIILPIVRKGAKHVWHQFVIRTQQRDELKEYLEKQGIGTIIHYPIPPHLSEAYQYLGIPVGSLPITEEYAQTVLSLPLYNGMTEGEQSRVIQAMNRW